jgi:hypothetical protein
VAGFHLLMSGGINVLTDKLITGHARRETLAIYQYVALDGELEAKYHESMKQVDL